MKTRKRVTERVLRANRANGRNSKGPRNFRYTSRNAVTRGLLANQIVFKDEAEKKIYDTLAADFMREHRPVGPTETTLVSEVTINLWRLRNLYGWESVELNTRKDAAIAILKGMRESNDAQRLPLSGVSEQGWHAEELVVRTGSRSSAEADPLTGEMTDTAGNVIIAAKLTSSLDTILRYEAAIKRDFYRSLFALRELQRTRLELERMLPGSGKENLEKE